MKVGPEGVLYRYPPLFALRQYFVVVHVVEISHHECVVPFATYLHGLDLVNVSLKALGCEAWNPAKKTCWRRMTTSLVTSVRVSLSLLFSLLHMGVF